MKSLVKKVAAIVLAALTVTSMTALLAGCAGADGTDGADGVSVESVEINENGELIVTFSDGSLWPLLQKNTAKLRRSCRYFA